MRPATILAAAALPLLAACSGDGSAPDLTLTQEFSDRVEAFTELDGELRAGTNGNGDAANANGVAEYTGYAGIDLDTTGVSQLVGRSTIEVDFTENDWSGTLSDFIGRIEGGSVQDFDNSLTIAGQNGLAGDGSLSGTISGTLAGDNGDDLTLSGPVEGQFVNLAPLLLAGVLVADDNGLTFTLNGDTVTGDLAVAAEKAP